MLIIITQFQLYSFFLPQLTNLPTSQTCFFQLRLPNYPSQEILAEKLRYAIMNCRSIDMDNYMLRRNVSTPGDSDDTDYYDDYDDYDDEESD